MFALGFVVFAMSSLLCGLSQTVLQLILARFIQGVGGAMLQSSSRALASESVTEDLAGRAQGYIDHRSSYRVYSWAEHRRLDD